MNFTFRSIYYRKTSLVLVLQRLQSSAETQDNSALASIIVIIHTPTPTPTPMLTPTPVPTSVSEVGPRTGILTSQWPPIIFIGFLSLSAMMVLFLATIVTQFTHKDDSSVCREGMSMLRNGVFLIFIIYAILIMALGRGIENNGAISILSAILGYVFGRGTLNTVVQKDGKQQDKTYCGCSVINADQYGRIHITQDATYPDIVILSEERAKNPHIIRPILVDSQ